MTTNRRRFLIGAAVAAVPASAISGTILKRRQRQASQSETDDSRSNSDQGETDEAHVQEADNWDRINVVEHGITNDGDTDITAAVQDLIEPYRTLVFPDGVYKKQDTDPINVMDPLRVVCEGNVSFDFEGGLFWSVGTSSAPVDFFEFVGNGTTIDVDGVDGRVFLLYSGNHHQLSDVTLSGTMAATEWGGARFDAAADATVVARNLSMTGGGQDRATGINVNPAGERCVIRIIDCHLEGWEDNGLYGYSGPGRLIVSGGTYRNNGISQVRSQSDNTKIENVDVVVDDVDDVLSPRGIRLRDGNHHHIDNCAIVARGDESYLPMQITEEVGSVTVSNTSFTLEETDTGLTIPPHDGNPSESMVRFENCDVTQSGSESGRFLQTFRPTRISGCQFTLESWAGIEAWNENVTISDSIGTFGPHYAVQIEAPGVTVRNNQFEPTESHPAVGITEDTGEVWIDGNILENGIQDEGGNTVHGDNRIT